MEDKKIIDDIFNLGKSSDCINDELLCRYIDATVTKSEAAAIEKHLNSCPACFNDMVSIVKNSLSPITDFEKNEINKLRTITRDEQVTSHLRGAEKSKLVLLLNKEWKNFMKNGFILNLAGDRRLLPLL